jgi:hypothetical protein
MIAISPEAIYHNILKIILNHISYSVINIILAKNFYKKTTLNINQKFILNTEKHK